MPDNEKQFESDIEQYLITAGGWQQATEAGYRSAESAGMALDIGDYPRFCVNLREGVR